MIKSSIKELLAALASKAISSVELTTIFLQRIEQYQSLNSFISLDADYAVEQAHKADKKIATTGHEGLLGLPIAHKDVFCTHHFKTTAASKMLANYTSPYEATIVKKLSDAGVITLGKTNMDEFSMGNSNRSSYFGASYNPWNTQCVPGGSSGGSAAAVAASLISCATGSDTGGSVRQPAAFCGVSGIKPTYGLASRFGMVAYASSLDQAGLIARSAEDLAIVLPHMLGFDSNDSTSIDKPVTSILPKLNESIQGLKIGVPAGFFDTHLDLEIQKTIKAAIQVLEQVGAIIIPVELKLQPLWVPCYYVIACAEASSNLSRYDGIRYGHQKANAVSLEDLITQSRTEGFGEEVKRRILTGTYVLSSGYFDAYYAQALKIRRLIQQEFVETFKKVDLILGPTTPSTAFTMSDSKPTPEESYLADIFTVAANLAGLPALSIPAGFVHEMPVGMQFIGPFYSEATLLTTAHNYQHVTDWHQQSPQGF